MECVKHCLTLKYFLHIQRVCEIFKTSTNEQPTIQNPNERREWMG
jgi:hypothetical protein